MINLSVFLNTKVENAGCLAWMGDLGLASARYLFDGNTVRIEGNGNFDFHIHHVTSFHKAGDNNISATTDRLGYAVGSARKACWKTALAVVLLVPGLIIGSIFKGLAYLSSTIRERHRLAVDHFTPYDLSIRSDRPIVSTGDLCVELQDARYHNSRNRPIRNLTIHCRHPYSREDLVINREVNFTSINPMKLILIGARIEQNLSRSFYTTNEVCPDPSTYSLEWEPAPARTDETPAASPGVRVREVTTPQEAYDTPAPINPATNKPYRMLFYVRPPTPSRA